MSSEPLIEDDGYRLLMEIVTLSKSNRPYKDKIKELKPYLEQFIALRVMVGCLMKNLEEFQLEKKQ